MKDVIVILAGGINSDGSLPDLPKRRVDAGVSLFKYGVAPELIMSGKYGFWLDWTKEVPSQTEASAMKKYAAALGVPEQHIHLEEDSKDTLGNAYFTKINILEPRNWKNITVVTSDFHFHRTKYIFDLVLGTRYEIEYVLTDTGLSKDDDDALKSQEEKTMVVLKDLIGNNATTGDTEAIRDILFLKHPGYSDNPELSYEKLRELLGRGN